MTQSISKAPAARVLPEVEQFIARRHRLLIDGQWIDAASGKTFVTVDPSNGEALADIAEGAAEDVDRAVRAARRALNGPWKRITPSERGRMLWKLAELIEARTEEFAQLDTLDNGMPLAASRGNAPYAAEILRYHAGWTTKIAGSTHPISAPVVGDETYLAYTVREPVGVVGQIIPWNVPLPLVAAKIAPALAAGCTIILKPAEQTPLSALRCAELILEAGFPPGVVNIITGFGEVAGKALAEHLDVDKISFTGSTETGRAIIGASRTNLKRVALELGGKSPNIVFDDADLETAVPGAAVAIFANAGQICTAGSRLYVQRRVFDRVVEGVAERAAKIKVGPGFDPDSQMGPVVSKVQHQRVLGYLDSGIAEGAKAVVGGRKARDKGYFVEPTVLVDTKPQMKIVREEIFGPVVCAIPFDDPSEILAAANDTPFGLAAAVWTRDVTVAHRVAAGLNAGTVWINAYHLYDVALPFGGYKQSGWGREFGREGVEAYTEVKTVIVKA